jgi:hypothetical protein
MRDKLESTEKTVQKRTAVQKRGQQYRIESSSIEVGQ